MSKTWRLKPKAGGRFRGGHPWVFSNELESSPKGIEPGECITLEDASGNFLARGFGNPHSLIAFRALCRDEKVSDPTLPEFIRQSVQRAASLRNRLGLISTSHRLCFGETDDLPGLIIDAYKTVGALPKEWVVVFQCQTAGMDRLFREHTELAVKICDDVYGPGNACGLFRNDASSRQLEGLPLEEPHWFTPVSDAPVITVTMNYGETETHVDTDVLHGQKTGLFLDQRSNISQILQLLSSMNLQGTVNVLDLCCYVGQWSAALSKKMSSMGATTMATLVDASSAALSRAQHNVVINGGQSKAIEMDVMESWNKIPQAFFDVVVCDPPAFIKGRKNLDAGKRGYLKLNREALLRVKKGGLFITCSCSGLLETEDFISVVAAAENKSGRRVAWIGQGTQAMDHPIRLNFPEGRYLKALIGLVED